MRTERPHALLAGRYRLEEAIGHTPVGAAWRATDTVLHRPVVVELIHPDLSGDPSFPARFAEETRALARVVHHGVARLLDAGSEDQVYFVVRQDVEGRTLEDVLADGPLPVADAVRVTVAVLAALSEVHAAGVLHLELEPAGVVLEPDGHPRLSELGVAAVAAGRADDHAPARERTAPEQRAGRPPDPRTDVWGAGTLLFELLTGRVPEGPAASPRALRREVPRSVDAAVIRALAPDPADRFPSAEAFAAALATAAGELDTAASPQPDGVEVAPRRSSLFGTWLAVPLLVLVVAVAAVVVGLSLGRLELGGPVGIRIRAPETSPSPSVSSLALPIASVRTFDPPPGDGQENDSGLPFAVDGDPATAWKSENYFDGELHKPGVGLLFDLGRSRTVTGFRLSTPFPG
ncbi:MAG: serine/threonine-protein kinase, partial [Candidatus Velamenicoccus archaeovorus]